jgi:uncharacterized coiled-coil DUF342 family protein
MTGYKEMICAYRDSITLLQSRIDQLNEKIREYRGGAGEALGSMVDRRYKLYQEIWELQGDVRMMMEYVEAVEGRNAEITLATA